MLDEAHVFHAQALGFMQRRRVRTATCPLVENGVIRVFNLPGFSVVGVKLGEICAGMNHAFWPDDLSLRTPGVVNWPRVLGHNQITDVYLLALAVARGGCLVTLDHRVALSIVVGATAENQMLL